jgi:hypothetical protein
MERESKGRPLIPVDNRVSGGAAGVAELTEEELVDRIVELLTEAFITELGEELRKELLEELKGAIVDSGASQTFVTKAVTLLNAQSCSGTVRIATGMTEKIVEKGELGPLKGALKVNSFTRTLIGVRDLADQFGGVYFDSKHVHVVSKKDDKVISTKIGEATKARLYSFDLEALEKHVKEFERLGQVSEAK